MFGASVVPSRRGFRRNPATLGKRALSGTKEMCGITGAAWIAGSQPLELAVLERMTTALAHRGPDDSGYYNTASSPAAIERPGNSAGPGAALGHRRLSIIDLAGGHQPLSNEDGSIWITFNGEIYNYRELQA